VGAGFHAVSGRALSFGANAALYDRARPSYPAELVDALLVETAQSVLDVGCGTGKAGRLFAARGCEVLGVEPDAAMAAVARTHGLTVEVSPFEEWDPAGRRFDLAICAQAWHWLDHARAVPKLAEVLAPGGRFAALWNFGAPADKTTPLLDAAYAEHAPELARATPFARGAYPDRVDESDERWSDLDETPGFSPPERILVEWHQTYSRAEWIDQLRTYSDHALLPAETRERLLAAIGAILDEQGGALDVNYRAFALVVRRTG
jgi:SAM-dependent methyltransferase